MALWKSHIRPRLTLWKRPLKPELLKLLLAAVWFVICIYAVAIANAYADRENTNENLPPDQRYVAPDPLMKATNAWFVRSSLPQGISDTLVGISAALLFAFALTRGPACITIVRRALLIVGSLYLGRVVYMTVTVFPAPWRYCFTEIDPNFGVDTWKLFSGGRVDCGDTFYSATDVIGSAVFTFLCWWLFHLAVEIDEIGRQRWWGRLIRWFDNNGHEVLEDVEGPKRLMMAATGQPRGNNPRVVEPEELALEDIPGLPTTQSERPPSMSTRNSFDHRGGGGAGGGSSRNSEIVELPRMALSGVSGPDYDDYQHSRRSSDSRRYVDASGRLRA
ncbi:hypothetical protein HDU86_001463 [Geranomyces michiganensis]|nr:hypothetical protein HDU86_001463 [Geranomyces michiganensis]